jgi:hypothetical protein
MNVKKLAIFIEFTFICANNLKLVEFRNSKFSLQVFIFLPILPHFLLCHPGPAAPNYVSANRLRRKVQITCTKIDAT